MAYDYRKRSNAILEDVNRQIRNLTVKIIPVVVNFNSYRSARKAVLTVVGFLFSPKIIQSLLALLYTCLELRLIFINYKTATIPRCRLNCGITTVINFASHYVWVDLLLHGIHVNFFTVNQNVGKSLKCFLT